MGGQIRGQAATQGQEAIKDRLDSTVGNDQEENGESGKSIGRAEAERNQTPVGQ